MINNGAPYQLIKNYIRFNIKNGERKEEPNVKNIEIKLNGVIADTIMTNYTKDKKKHPHGYVS